MHHPTRRSRSSPAVPRATRFARVGLAAVALAITAATPTMASARGAQDPGATTTVLPGIDVVIPAPHTTTSADGLTTTDGSRVLHLDRANDIDPAGATITVTGRGYDASKGIYLAFCVLPQEDQRPTPCGGGADTEGTTGSSKWISSNPPPYGRGLAVPYGADASFDATIHVTPIVAEGVDCRIVQCGIVTRNDHVRSSDRSQDLFVPLHFAGSDPKPAPPTTTTTDPTATTPSTVPVTVLAPATPSTTKAPAGAAKPGSTGSSDDDGLSAAPVGIAIVGVAAVLGAGWFLVGRRRGRLAEAAT